VNKQHLEQLLDGLTDTQYMKLTQCLGAFSWSSQEQELSTLTDLHAMRTIVDIICGLIGLTDMELEEVWRTMNSVTRAITVLST